MTIRVDFLILTSFASLALLLGTPGCARRSAVAPLAPAAAPPVAAAPEVPPPSEPPAPVAPPELAPAFFDFDSQLLSESARQALDDVAKVMRDNAAFLVTIEGHCDERGTTEYNMALGERRAFAAAQYLLMAGVTKERIQMVSLGEERPFETGHDEFAWGMNRRAHFHISQSTLSGVAPAEETK